MMWPGWGDVLPTATLIAALAGMCWSVVRLMVVPVAERAAAEAEKQSAETTRLAVDGLYERLKRNDFRHVEDGLKALGDRIDGVEAQLGARIDGVEAQLGARIDGVEAQLGARIDGVEAQLGARLDRARQDRRDMEARLMDAIAGRSGPPEGS